MNDVAFLVNKSKVLMRLPVRILNVDDSYQKPLSRAHVKGIVKNFDPMGIGQIHVSKRSDGTFWIFDGQHRASAYTTKGIKEIDCIVYEGLTIDEESRGYIYYNTIKTQHALDLAKVELKIGDPSMIAIDAVVTSLGLEIDYYRTNKNDALQAIGSIKIVYKKGGSSDLKMVLKILNQALGSHKKNFQGIFLLGLHQFITEYRVVYDEKWLIKSIKRVGLDDLMNKARSFRSAHNGDKKTAIKLALINAYNFNRGKENKL